MKRSLKMILVLAVVGLISGASLALVYRYTIPQIELNQEKELELSIFKLFPSGKRYEAMDEKETVYRVMDRQRRPVGYAFIAEGNGYQGKIKVMAGLKEDLSALTGIEVLGSVETPGLGGEITSDDFRAQFKNLEISPEIICAKAERARPNEIQAITAATISSKSIVNILNKKIKETREVIQGTGVRPR